MKILAGDIGGTKSDLAIFDTDKPHVLQFGMGFLNHEQANLISMLQNFIANAGMPIRAACLAVAGTVRNGRCHMPNLSWILDEQEISVALGIERVTLINDLAATAHGMLTLPPEELMVINSGISEAKGNIALIAAGTGLGEAILFHHEKDGYQVAASEGGHVDYAPNNEEEIELLRYLWSRFGHASWERVVSGLGLVNIYDFLSQTAKVAEPTQVTSRITAAADRAAAIAQTAQLKESPRCVLAMDIFLHNYGAAAGNLALKALATGGIYIGGGIAPKLPRDIWKGCFMQAFSNKGRFDDMLSNIPVKLILEPKTALLGAAAYAASWDFIVKKD